MFSGNVLSRFAKWGIESNTGRRTVAVVSVVVAAALVFGIPIAQSFIPYRIDLDVYRLGGKALLAGADLYGQLPPTAVGISLPFTYPPIAAAFFVPLALAPFWLANLLLSISTLAATWGVGAQILRRECDESGDKLFRAKVLVFAAALLFGPIRETVGYGQINAVLMFLVVLDLVAGRGRRWRGMLVGCAMAIKLTPAVFLAYFLIRRDWRALGQAMMAAAICTAVGFLLAPQSSVQYWTSTIFDPSRIGGLAYVSNQSISGALVRLGLGDGRTAVWFVLCAVLGISSLLAMRWAFQAGEETGAMLLMGLFSLIASPVSWSHHWVWAVPTTLLVAIWHRRQPSIGKLVIIVSSLVIFPIRIIWFMPHEGDRELNWDWWQQLLGNAQTIWGLAAMAYIASYVYAASRRKRSAVQADIGASKSPIVESHG